MMRPTHEVGTKVVLMDYRTGNRHTYVVVDVMARLTPFRRKDQDTKVVGYTYGLKQVANFPLLDAMPFREESL
jgi:hypothetical protein